METLATNPPGNGRYTKVSRRPTKKKKHRPSTRRRTSSAERGLIYAIAAVAAVGGLFAGCEPTGITVLNLALTAGFAAVVSLAASRARRWSWLVMSGFAVLGASGPWLAVAAAALLVGLAASLISRRRAFGSVVGALAVQSLLRMPDLSAPLASAALAAAAVLPVLISGYLASPNRVKRWVHRSLLVGAGVIVLGGLTFAVAAGLGVSSANRAAADTHEGLDAVRNGKTEKAVGLLRSASRSFGDTNAKLTAWWSKPALAVPLLAQQSQTLALTTEEGRRVTAAAADVTESVDYESLRYRDGRVNIDRLRQVQAPLADAALVFNGALDESVAQKSPWVVGPLQDKVEEFQTELKKASREANFATDSVRVLPGLLGGDGTRRYFVAFITPSEQRGLGGFMGNWAELTATDGRLELTRSGRAAELGRYPGSEAKLITTDPDYAARYGRFRVGRYIQDVTLSPDLPSITRVIGELYPQSPGGSKIDGVLTVDPQGLAALLELSGPISVPGLAEPLTSKNATEILTKKQYLDFDSRAERADFLDEAGHRTFEKLIDADLPGPRRLADVLAPAVEKNRIMFSAVNPDEERFFASLGASGAFPKPDDGDFFSLRTQNRGNNKIDMFLERRIDYRVSYDPQTKAVQAHAEITLKNNAPPTGLPDAIIGSGDQGLPLGTNALHLDFYTPHGLKEAKVGDEVVSMEYQRELGYAVYSRLVQIPPGGTVVVKLDLFGSLKARGDMYNLTLSQQPTVNPDHVVATVEVPNDYRFLPSKVNGPALAVQAQRNQAVWAGDPATDVKLSVRSTER